MAIVKDAKANVARAEAARALSEGRAIFVYRCNVRLSVPGSAAPCPVPPRSSRPLRARAGHCLTRLTAAPSPGTARSSCYSGARLSRTILAPQSSATWTAVAESRNP